MKIVCHGREILEGRMVERRCGHKGIKRTERMKKGKFEERISLRIGIKNNSMQTEGKRRKYYFDV